jgi:hypothetical protein
MMDDIAANRAIENGLTSYLNVPYGAPGSLDGRTPNHGRAVGLAAAAPRPVTVLVHNGRTLEKVVLTRPPTAKGVPVLVGLSAEDWIIADARGLTGGKRVRVRQ